MLSLKKKFKQNNFIFGLRKMLNILCETISKLHLKYKRKNITW